LKVKKDFLILLGGRGAQAILALVAIRLLTGLLDKENVGMTYLVTSLASYFSLIFINPLGMYFNRRLHLWFQEKKIFSAFRFLNGYFLLIALLSVPLVLISHFFLNIGSGFLSWEICFLVFLNIYAGTWFQTLCPTLNMLEYRGAFVTITLIAQVLGLGFSILGVLFVQKTAFIWLLGILLGQSAGALLAWLYFRKHVLEEGGEHPKDGFSPLFMSKSVLYFCLPIALTTAFMWGQNQSYRLIVESKMGAEALGILGVGLGVAASIAGLIESLVNQYFYPTYYSAISNGAVDVRAKAWRILCLNSLSVYLPTTAFVVFGAAYILRVLISAKFDDSLALVAWGAVIEFFRMTTNLIYAVSQSEMKTKSTVVPYAFGALTVIAGLVAAMQLASPMKLVYVPYILVLAGLIACVSMYWSMKKILPISFDVPFICRNLLYSIPFVGMLFLEDQSESLFASILICGLFGAYLSWVIWRLQHRVQLIVKAL
jgi:O-antigen/teichoic acid export membrane protein